MTLLAVLDARQLAPTRSRKEEKESLPQLNNLIGTIPPHAYAANAGSLS
jgi:hypothetical protein